MQANMYALFGFNLSKKITFENNILLLNENFLYPCFKAMLCENKLKYFKKYENSN